MKIDWQKTSYFNIKSDAHPVSYDLNFINIPKADQNPQKFGEEIQ